MDTDSALQLINAKITTLSPADRTTVFQTSDLIQTTTDTHLDSGQIIVLALIRGVKTWKFYHMNVPDKPTEIAMTEVTLACAEADPAINNGNCVGASILVNAGNAAHWDLVTTMAQKAHWLGTTEGSVDVYYSLPVVLVHFSRTHVRRLCPPLIPHISSRCIYIRMAFSALYIHP
jgi:hypothetical protein